MITEIFAALKEPLTALGRLLNPDRKREQIKDQALEAAGNLLEIYQALYEGGGGAYKTWDKKRLEKYKAHYLRQYNAWKDGTS